MRVAVAGVPGGWSTERMCEALKREGIDSFVFSLGACLHDINARRVTLHGLDLTTLDGIVVKKLAPQPDPSAPLRLHLLRELEFQNLRIYSRPDAIEAAMDRYRMSMVMANAGLPLPPTFSFEDEAGMVEALGRLGSAVLKPVYTSKGRGMVRLDAATARPAEWLEDGRGRTLLQAFIEAPGRDVGACILGGKFVGAFYRVARDGEWMTTTAAGGAYAPCELPKEGIELAQRVAKLFRLDYTVVDLVESKQGYYVYEVSAFGGFRGLWEARGFDVATEYARYVKRDLSS